MREYTDHKNSEYGHFSRSVRYLNQFIPYQQFKMEGLFLPPGITTEGRLYVQAEYGRWLFFSSTATFIIQES